MHTPFKAIAAFHATARFGSLTKAAEDLGVTPSAISQQLRFLERHLGTALVTKMGRGIRLTEAGERYFGMIADGVERIGAATERLRGDNAITVLSIRAAPTFADKVILPRLPAFLETHPDLEVRLDANNEPPDFARENIDLEIRHGEGHWPGLYVEGLAEETVRPLCAPGLAAAASLGVADLPDFRLIHSVKNLIQWAQWFQMVGVQPHRRWRRVMFDRAHMAIDTAVAGFGIVLESDFVTWREQRDRLLVCPVRDAPKITVAALWIVCPHGYLRKPQVRLFIDWLKTQVGTINAER